MDQRICSSSGSEPYQSACQYRLGERRHRHKRYYDRDARDYHVYDQQEDRAYRSYLRERKYEYRSLARQRRERQREYWRWRHLHPGVVVEFHR